MTEENEIARIVAGKVLDGVLPHQSRNTRWKVSVTPSTLQ
jgi:hypothetical protein